VFVLRLLAILTLIAVAGGLVAYALTRQPKYLQFSGRVFKAAVVIALLVFALLILERVSVLPL
jgi:hypothetical protein